MSIRMDEVNRCIDCGKCGEICPICHVSDKMIYTPDNKIRQLQKLEARERPEKDGIDSIYLCTRCGACNDICPVGIDISGIIQYERQLLSKLGWEPEKTAHISKNIIEKRNPKGLDIAVMSDLWRSEDLEFSDDSKIAYIAGCWVSLKNLGIAQDTVRVLNACGIRPRLLSDERCCGLFVIDNGHLDSIKVYAKDYTEYIESQGVDTLLVSCPACYNVIKNLYPTFFREPRYKVVSTLEMFSTLHGEGRIKFKKTEGKVSLRDACPMKEVFGVPRKLLEDMGYELVEPFEGQVFCCGAPAGVKPNFPEISNAIGRITFERSEGADMIASYCSFCKHHLDTISEADGKGLPVEDISHFVWTNMQK